MKKFLVIFIILTLFVLSAFPQANFYISESVHYKVYSDQSEGFAQNIADKMEACFTIYNNLLHFDTSYLPTKLRVKIFKDKKSFDSYLKKLLNQTREDFVYIHYYDLEKSELVGFNKNSQRDFDSSLLHQGFIQFIKTFIPGSPIWLREGTAAYLENSKYNPTTKRFEWKPNLDWLDTLKGIIRKENGESLIPLNKLLLMTKQEAIKNINIFYPEAWGLVHFLINSSVKEYNRIYWDSLSALQANLSVEENSKRIIKRAFSWVNSDRLMKDYTSYIMSLKTFYDYVKEGVNYYNKNELQKAEQSFKSAVHLNPDNHIPYYYLGLTYYTEKKYREAKQYYEKAKKLGTDRGLINYALGVNAFAENKFDEAIKYLKKAKEIDEKTYGAKVDSLLKRIELLK